tara:strand:- start:178 stop:2079 length:1902 start_codon:yes stop_codon:yes gene_type:complete
MKYIYLNTLILFSICISEFTNPINGEIFNYTDILFEWNQANGNIDSYSLKVYHNDEQVQTVIDTTLATIITDFEWGENYLIELRGINESGQFSELLDVIEINIMELNTEYDQPDIFINNAGYQEGYTIIKERIIDRYGNVIYFWPYDPLLYCITEILDNGEFIGFQSGPGTSQNNGIKSDLKGNISWRSPERVIRELLPINLNNNPHYIGLVKEEYVCPTPIQLLNLPQWQESGIDSVTCFSDQIVIWDELGNDIWRWSSRENYSFEDIDQNFVDYLYGDSTPTYYLNFDWTHANSVYYDNLDNSIYFNTRHLSRISKIDYPTGEILWNLGKDLPSDDPVFGENLNISGQHAIRRLDNGNLMIYNNGNFNNPEVSSGLEIRINGDDEFPSAERVWEYTLIDSLYTFKHGDCDRLENGNSLLTAGQQNTLVEVDSLNNIVWAARVGSQYRSLRIPHLYPLIFSVKNPYFNEDSQDPLVYIPLDESIFKFEIFNEGYHNFDFQYNISDELGYFNSNGIVSLLSEESGLVEIPINISNHFTSNLITLEVCPLSIHQTDCKEILINSTSCSYIDEISYDCLNNNIGDLNDDGGLNILDIVYIINLILVNQFEENADLNFDEIVNVQDIIQLVNMILN